MAKTLMPKVVLALVVLTAVLNTRWNTTFMPPAGRVPARQLASSVGAVGALASLFGAAPSAQADVEEAAGHLADTMYPLFDKVDWQRNQVFAKWLATAPEKWDGKKLNIALDKLLEAGLAMDQSLVAKSVQAHLKGIVAGGADNNALLKANAADVKDITVSIANMLVSAGAPKIKAVFDGFKAVGINDLNREEMKTIGKMSVGESYKAFLLLAEEIKKVAPV